MGGMQLIALVQESELDAQPGRKTPVYIEDIGPFNDTILSTQKKPFDLGFQRIQVCLFNLLGIFTVHRTSALLGLDPDVELMRAVARQSRWRDTRRLPYLTDQQRRQVENHPDLEEARRNLSTIRVQYEETQPPGLLPRP